MEPTGTPKISGNHKKSQKDGLESALQFSTSKNINNLWFWEALGPAESCRDSSENVVFTNSPNHEKMFKIDSNSMYFGGPGDTKIAKSWKTWANGKYMKKHTLENTEKVQKKPKWTPEIDPESIKNRRLGRCLPAGLQNVDFGVWGGFSGFRGCPRGPKLIKNVEKRPYRTLENNAMSCWVPFTRYPLAIAMPYSRGGRSEAQHNFYSTNQHASRRKKLLFYESLLRERSNLYSTSHYATRKKFLLYASLLF